jgi:sigma-B regulation protein RsbU (phosphoserine phosphatase)
MPPAPLPRVLLVGDPPPDDARAPLEDAGLSVTPTTFAGLTSGEAARSGLVIFDVSPRTAVTAQALCRRWRLDLGEQYVPIVWLCFDGSPALLAGALESGADVCLPRPFDPAHLLAQARALLRVGQMSARLGARAVEAQHINARLQQAYHQIDGDLEMAQRIQRSFLPRVLPEVQRARFAVCHRPRSRAGGDFYDVIRLDEDNVGLYVADATGHGLPSTSLLSIFVRKSLRVKEITGTGYRLVPPSEVLAGINRELLALGLAEPPFVTMLYLRLNGRDGSATFARASHPPPLHVPARGDIAPWPAPGSLLGVFEAEHPEQSRQLQPGDKLLVYSDGVNAPSLPATTPDPLLAAAEKYRGEPLPSFVDLVSRDLLEGSPSPEDFTLLGVEYR